VIRDQEFLLPPNMADWLPQDHLVWFVLDVVDQLDTTRFHAQMRTGGVGRQGFDPDMLLALLLYAYAVGERSSRRIERLCLDHVAFRVVCGQDAPDHTTIARFRARHQDAFADVFAQVLRLCAAAGMVKVGIVSIDGTKIAANASRGANRSGAAVRHEAQRIAHEIVAEAARVDAAEDARGDDDDLPPGFADRSGRAANIKKALAELDAQDAEHTRADQGDRHRIEDLLARLEAGEALHGPVPAGADPIAWYRARITGLARHLAELDGLGGIEASRARTELRRRLRRAEQMLAAAEDQAATGTLDLRGRAARERARRTRRAQGRGGTGPTVNVSDPDSRLMTHGAGGGSVQGYNAQVAVTDDHLILGVHVSQDANDTHCFAPALNGAVLAATGLDLQIETVLADAGYFTEENLTMPGPDRLIAPGKHRDLPTGTGTDPAPGPAPGDASAKELMRHRLRTPEAAAIYKRRSATVETLIAHLKDHIGLRRFSRRGLTAATAELNLAAAVVNLRRLHTSALATS
jgi:transposase